MQNCKTAYCELNNLYLYRCFFIWKVNCFLDLTSSIHMQSCLLIKSSYYIVHFIFRYLCVFLNLIVNNVFFTNTQKLTLFLGFHYLFNGSANGSLFVLTFWFLDTVPKEGSFFFYLLNVRDKPAWILISVWVLTMSVSPSA